MRLMIGVMVVGMCMSARGAERVVLVAPMGDAKLVTPFGVVHDSLGRLLIVEYASRVQTMDARGNLTTIAGDGTKGDAGDDGPATAAKLNSPHSIAVGGDGAIYVADSLNDRIRRIDPKTGVISTFAGTTKGSSGDGGPADKAQFNGIYCISFNPARDQLIVTDLENRRIRAIEMKSAVVRTVAGNGMKGVPEDGAAAANAPLVDPRAATMDSKGNVYVLERGGNALRVVDAGGKIRTLIAGPKEAKGARILSGPKHLCVDKEDNVIIADTDNHRIVKWLAGEKKLMLVAGSGTKGTAGVGGPPEKLQLNQPHGVYLDGQGVLYICDSFNGRVLRIEK